MRLLEECYKDEFDDLSDNEYYIEDKQFHYFKLSDEIYKRWVDDFIEKRITRKGWCVFGKLCFENSKIIG